MFLTLLEMAVGGLAALLLTDWRGEATRGFLRLCAGCLVPLALFAWLVPGTRPSPVDVWTLLLVLGSLAYFVLLIPATALTPRRLVGLAVVVGGVALLAYLCLTAPIAPADRSLFAVAVLADTLVVGASGVALVLGHWYLVTPRLTAKPLRRLVDLLLVGLALEAILVLWPLIAPSGPAGSAMFDDVVTWGRLFALVVLPVGMAIATRACCREWPRGRALQAATGLLYVVVGSTLGGVMLGNMLRLSPA